MPSQDVVVRFIGSTGNLEKGLDGLQGRFTAVATSLKGIATTAVAVGAFNYFKTAIAGATDLAETTSKVGVVFGRVAPQIRQFAETADRSLGQSKRSAMDAAATFATFGKGAGLVGDRLAKFSIDMVKLASDMASFSNTTPQEAIDALGAALRGESDPIEKYGVLLNEAVIQQRGLKMGLIATTSEALTPQQRVLAAQAEIFAQTTDAQGDFARTQDGLANQQRILTAEFENASAELGAAFIPTVQTAVKFISNDLMPAFTAVGHVVSNTLVPTLDFASSAVRTLVNTFGELPGPLQAGAVALGAWLLLGSRIQGVFGSASGSLANFRSDVQSVMTASGGEVNRFGASLQVLQDRVPTIGAIGAAFRTAKGDAEGFGSTLHGVAAGGFAAFKGAALGLVGFLGGPWGVAITAATVGIGYFISKNREAEARQREFADAGKLVAQALRDQNGVINESVRRVAARQAEEKGLLKAAKDLGVTLPEVTDAILGQGNAYERIKTRLQALMEANHAYTLDVHQGQKVRSDSLNAEGQRYQQLLDDLNLIVGGKNEDIAASKRQDQATQESAAGIEKLKANQEQAATSSDMLKAAVEGLGDKFDSTKTQGQHLVNVIEGLTAAQATAIDLEENYEAALDGLTESIKDNGRSLDIRTEKGRSNRDALEAAAASIRNMTLADIESGVPAQEAIARHDARVVALQKEANKLGLAQTESGKLIGAYSAIPKEVRTVITTQGFEATQARLAQLSAGQFLLEKGIALTPANLRQTIQERRFDNTFASGGYVTGPGGPTSDVIPAWLSNREFVQPASTVDYYGLTFMEALRRKQIPKMAAGGPVLAPFPVDVTKTHIPDTRLFPGGATIPTLQRFALAQRGKLYQWGATGPNMWDCSGLVGALWALAHGMAPYSRYMTTATMGVGRYGMKPGPGRFTVYLGPGHTAANIGGLHAEAYGGNGTPVAVGHVGTPLSFYHTVMHLARGGLVSLRNNAALRRQNFLERGWPEPMGFQGGGWLQPGQLAYNETSKPEAVFNQTQLAALGADMHVHFHGPVGSPRELENWLAGAHDRLKSKGRIK